MKTHFQLELDLSDAGKTYSLLSERTPAIKRQSPPPHSAQWHELHMTNERRRAALWAYSKIFAQMYADNVAIEPERKEA